MKRKFVIVTSVIFLILLGVFIGHNLTFHYETKAEPIINQYKSLNEQNLTNFNDAFVSVAEKSNPSVVTITTEKVIKQQTRRPNFDRSPFRDFFGDDLFNRFFGQVPEGDIRQRALGSGVIVRQDGYIITNNHVVKDFDVIKVKLIGDKEEYKAKVVGKDPKTDIAVLKIDKKNLPVLPFGDSDRLRVGEWVLAIGSPFGEELEHTVTAGIVSAKGRSGMGITQYEDFIQTDAAINPGNSGGAMINLKGELVGINSAIVTGGQGFQGVGFAVPINLAKNIMDKLMDKGKVVRGWLGVWIQDVSENTSNVLGLKGTKGAIIGDVTDNSPASKADLKVGDVVKKLDGKEIVGSKDLSSRIADIEPGTTVRLSIIREGEEKEVSVNLGEQPSEELASAPAEKSEETIGVKVSEITPNIASQLQIEPKETGVVITDINQAGIGAGAGLAVGDIIKKINKKDIKTVRDYNGIIKNLKKGDSVLMLIKRGDNSRFVSFRIPEE